MTRVMLKLCPALRYSGATGATAFFLGLILLFRILRMSAESSEDRFELFAIQVLASLTILVVHGGHRAVRTGQLFDLAFIRWLRHQSCGRSIRLPFGSASLNWQDFAIPVILALLMPLRWHARLLTNEIMQIIIAYHVSVMLAIWLLATIAHLWKAKIYWIIYLYAATLGGLILSTSHWAQTPIAIFGLYCITRSQIPTMLSRAFVEDPLKLPPEADPWIKLRSKRIAEAPVPILMTELAPARRYAEPSILHAASSGAVVAWLLFAISYRSTLHEPAGMLIIAAIVFGLVGLAHMMHLWLMYHRPRWTDRTSAGGWGMIAYARMHATRFASVALCALSVYFAALPDNVGLPYVSLSLGAAWTFLRLRTLGLEKMRLTGAHSLA